MRYVIYRHTRALDLTPDVATQLDAERYAMAMYGVGIWCWQADAVGADAWRMQSREAQADAAAGITTERAS